MWCHDLQNKVMLVNLPNIQRIIWVSFKEQATKRYLDSDTSDSGFEGNQHLLKISLYAFSDFC